MNSGHYYQVTRTGIRYVLQPQLRLPTLRLIVYTQVIQAEYAAIHTRHTHIHTRTHRIHTHTENRELHTMTCTHTCTSRLGDQSAVEQWWRSNTVTATAQLPMRMPWESLMLPTSQTQASHAVCCTEDSVHIHRHTSHTGTHHTQTHYSSARQMACRLRWYFNFTTFIFECCIEHHASFV